MGIKRIVKIRTEEMRTRASVANISETSRQNCRERERERERERGWREGERGREREGGRER